MSPARVLTVNAGSSSLKLSLLDGHDVLEEQAELAVGVAGLHADDVADVVRNWSSPDAVGHRIVHGGRDFTAATRIDAGVEQRLRELTELAPLHQPKSLAALDAVSAQFPDVPAVACFDTAFHAGMPAAAATYALPRDWRERYGLRRYGFHGLSHAYCARRSAELVGRAASELRIVSCHLGAGASLAAIDRGRSVDTTMGFTPLEGLVMATRCGSVDPGLLLWVQERESLSPSELTTVLEEQSGLLALAGTGDLREIEPAAERGDPAATLALEVYLHHLVGAIAAMSAAMAGLDVLAFTGGVGEHSATVRQRAADRLGFLGIAIDATANRGAADEDITAAGAGVRTVVVAAREDRQMAAEVRRCLDPTG
jgi:acetate kinase